MRYGFIIDQTTCIGCHACTVACKTEHEVPLGVNRTWVKYIEKGAWPDTKRFFSVMRCNHCTDAPCVEICPTSALFKRNDGIVDFDTDRCIGCKSCMQACPYDALYIDPGDHTAQKCNYCTHRIEVGLQPACVVVCPEQAIIAGDLDDPTTKIAQMVKTERLSQRAVEQGTRPNLWYRGAEEANLDPLAASNPGDGGLWQDPVGNWLAVDLSPTKPEAPGPTIRYESPDAPARVVYNNTHPMPWGWRVSSYFLTKAIAAGVAIVLALYLAVGGTTDSGWVRIGAPVVAGAMLALTGVLLVWDLKRPDRFLYLLTKGNPGSWLVRGAWILGAYALVLAVWFVLGVANATEALTAVIWIAAVVGLAVAGYTAFLFGQAEARDLWQSPSLLWHMIAGAFAAGGGATMVAALVLSMSDGVLLTTATRTMLVGVIVLGFILVVERSSQHPTRNIEEAMHHLIDGHYSTQWWFGGLGLGVVAAGALSITALAIGSVIVGAAAGIATMLGLWMSDDAFVRAGQSVPLS